LPYGLIGFISHVLTYYTAFMLTRGLTPFTWKKLKSPKLDLMLAVSSLIIGNIATIFKMIQCVQRWEFILIALWKAMLSITFSILS
ncbi:hypothetical protein FPQ18DRAFT_267591, partial [Pyronema domesticum]